MHARGARLLWLMVGPLTLLLGHGCYTPFWPWYDPGYGLTYREDLVETGENWVVFERAGFAPIPWGVHYVVAPGPVERVWVRVDLPDLQRTALASMQPDSYAIATDGEWVVEVTPEGTRARNAASGESTAIPGLGMSIDWPYVLVLGQNDGFDVFDVQGGTSRHFPGHFEYGNDWSTVSLFNGQVLYPEAMSETRDRLKLVDLPSGQETVLGESARCQRAWLPPTRAAWSAEKLYVYDKDTETVTTLGQNGLTWPGEVRDAGEPGILAAEFRGGQITLRLVGYDGQQRIIDVYTPRSTDDLRARFAGPCIVYQRSEDWVVYDTRDGSSRSIQPFEGM